MRLIEIVAGIFTRGQLRPGTTPRDLMSAGVNRVVSLTAAGEPSLEHWSGYTHCPMSDGVTVDEIKLKEVVDGILRNLRDDETTLVMCHAGRNRTGLVVCVVLCEWLEITGEESLCLFRERRPRGVANPAFEKFILGYQ